MPYAHGGLCPMPVVPHLSEKGYTFILIPHLSENAVFFYIR
jgi:hypothetical protein